MKTKRKPAMLTRLLLAVVALGLVAVLGAASAPPAGAQAAPGAPTPQQAVDLSRLLALEQAVQTLQLAVNALLTCVSFQEGEINGVGGPHLLITGCNVHIRSGSGATIDTTTNLGNLIIGYNEPREGDEGGADTTNRTGSHNLIVGPAHQFTASGGLLGGFRNTVSGFHASVSGGEGNTASGKIASVSGGLGNAASADFASVSGGVFNTASGKIASVSGGSSNTAGGGAASVSGGENNTASGIFASVSGGANNTALVHAASVSGGSNNTASGFFASVSGGDTRSASGNHDWVAGVLLEDF